MASPGRKAHRPKVAYVPPSNWHGLSCAQWHGEPVLHSVEVWSQSASGSPRQPMESPSWNLRYQHRRT